jgi:hypothetical protein
MINVAVAERNARTYCIAKVAHNALPQREPGTCGCIAGWLVNGQDYCKRHAMIVVWRCIVESKA